MTRNTLDAGPKTAYVRHGFLGGIGMVMVNAFRSRMPIWKNSGHISQLGGEFIFGPG